MIKAVLLQLIIANGHGEDRANLLVDKLTTTIVDRALQVKSADRTDLDKTTTGKAGNSLASFSTPQGAVPDQPSSNGVDGDGSSGSGSNQPISLISLGGDARSPSGHKRSLQAFTDMDMVKFEAKIRKALERVKVVLAANKSPRIAGEIHHKYQDKYMLVELMTNIGIASQTNMLLMLGLTQDHLAMLRDWVQDGQAVSLRFKSDEHCSFVRKEEKLIENPRQHVQEVKSRLQASTVTSKLLTKVTEYSWNLEVKYELVAIRGTGGQLADCVSITRREVHSELKTTSDVSPFPEVKLSASYHEVDVTWLLLQLGNGCSPCFRINRNQTKCCTPVRNLDTNEARTYFSAMESWAYAISQYFTHLFNIPQDRNVDLQCIDVANVFMPLLPLMEDVELRGATIIDAVSVDAVPNGSVVKLMDTSGDSDKTDNNVLLSLSDMNLFLEEEHRTLGEKKACISTTFVSNDSLINADSAFLIAIMKHSVDVCVQYDLATSYVEALLRKQIVAAIGKEVTPMDFAEYMKFHDKNIFLEAYEPTPFSYAVRRSGEHSPEGVISVEQEGNGIAEPISTFVARSPHPYPLQFPLGASSRVTFRGDRYLHALLLHQFSGHPASGISLVAKARQFSSMLVLIGRMVSATTFDPQYATIVQNKDELTIPLSASTIPTPKEFKDAIESLSLEQQRFAKAFRSMQLESTLLGIVVIQIKPQLERVLNLPPDSLAKEIKLTQELMELFIKYQIPSDLLSFESGTEPGGPGNRTERLEAVKSHVKAMREMIEASKVAELDEKNMQAKFHGAWITTTMYPEYLDAEEAEGRSAFGSLGMAPCGGAVGFGAFGSPMPMSNTRESVPMSYQACAGFGKGSGPVTRAIPQAPMPRATIKESTSFQKAAVTSPPSLGPSLPTFSPQPQSPQKRKDYQDDIDDNAGDAIALDRDYTQVPKEMDRHFEQFDDDSALKATIINVGERWSKKSQRALLGNPITSVLFGDEQKQERNAAFDLLDALTKSGALPIDHAALHVVVAATHVFDKSITDTVVQDSANPIEKVERSTLIMAATVHRKPVASLIREAHRHRVSQLSPAMFNQLTFESTKGS